LIPVKASLVGCQHPALHPYVQGLKTASRGARMSSLMETDFQESVGCGRWRCRKVAPGKGKGSSTETSRGDMRFKGNQTHSHTHKFFVGIIILRIMIPADSIGI
jgi:hypothetical protein